MKKLGLALGALLMSTSCNEYDLAIYANLDVFFQEPVEKVDILLVIDNSCSMADEQSRLGSSFDQFLTYFVEADVDYHIGVVTTGLVPSAPWQEGTIGCTQAQVNAAPVDGALADGAFITPETDDAASAFDTLVNQGICGSPFEMGLEAAKRALEEPNLTVNNAGFLREEAALSVIFVSDEEDYSPDGVNDYINFFRGIKGHRSRDVFNASALVGLEGEPCPLGNAAFGSRYVDIADQTGGITGNICELDFETVVTDLSLNSSRLRDTYFLSATPLVNTITVGVDGDEISCEDGDWTFQMVFDEVEAAERPAIVFDRLAMPEPSSQISVRYNAGDVNMDDFCTGTGVGE